ncbi:MAG: hypothetical protein SVX38_15220, partial [Chloroflexota bacterium]|nr:hypothetical protein [Chloroflexota bacterium]
FGNIASQIIGYYLIAIVCIPLGYGHLKVRRWARVLSLTLLRFWLVVGLPLAFVFLFIAAASKELSPFVAVIMIVFMALSYFVLPGLLIRFYRSRDVRLTFEARDPKSYWIEKLPMPILVLCSLYLFYLIVLHIPIFFNGIFPLFGVFLFDLPGIVLLDVSIMALACLIWGTFRQKPWAWWGSLVYWGLMTFSSILTFSRYSYLDILSRMKFPPTEIEILDGLPFQGFHFAVFFGIPLLITLTVIVLSKKHFGAGNQALSR